VNLKEVFKSEVFKSENILSIIHELTKNQIIVAKTLLRNYYIYKDFKDIIEV